MQTSKQAREEFPQTAKIVDLFRKHFGAGVKVRWAEENGKTVGRKEDE